jgi:tyrosinase
MKKLYITILFVVTLVSSIFSQSIRKNYLEMSPSEITNYRAALQLLWSSGSTAIGKHMYFANAHSSHFSDNIHSFTTTLKGVNFTSFHRYFLLHWELSLRSTSPAYAYLSLPYWDWRTYPDKSLTTLTPQNAPDFILFTLLPKADFVSWGLTRNSTFNGNDSNLPNTAGVNTTFGYSSFYIDNNTSCFTRSVESNHNGPHVFIGGDMNSGVSPKDPVFYIHHAMIDKLWNDWEEQSTGIQSAFPTGASPIPHYNTASPSNWIDNLNPADAADSRYIKFRPSASLPVTTKYDVWYAENGIVLLDGSNGTAFSAIGTKMYRYGAWNKAANKMEGIIYVGDVKRSGTTVVADNKGGFIVPAGATVEFHAGKEISFKPGTELKSGSTVNAKIVYP